MKVVGTNDEITYIMLQCQRKTNEECNACVLSTFCGKGMFMRMKPSQLDALETGKHKPILISKGDDNSETERDSGQDCTDT